ncbi:MAG TPA: DUF3226 domain-containing protein [Armatimonadota bacterium]|jgi:hypothetical protein
MSRPSGGRRVLLLEGRDDLMVVENLRKSHGMPETFSLVDQGGIEPLLEGLPALVGPGSGNTHVGVLVDADTHLERRWQAVRDILKRAGYTDLPQVPVQDGSIHTPPDRSQPTVGVWLMPNNQLPGMLEDFVAMLVPQDDALWPRALAAVEAIPEEHRRFAAAHTAKARIHTWLAWQERPGTPMGAAINQRYLASGCPEANSFVGWLRRLFPETPPGHS